MKNIKQEFEQLFGLEEVESKIFTLKKCLKEYEKTSNGLPLVECLEAEFKREYLSNREYKKLYKEAKEIVEEERAARYSGYSFQ